MNSWQQYRDDLALVHDLGFGFHAERCRNGILTLLEPVRRAGGVVLELGCGSGALTRYLVDAGHRVIATDASPAMLERCRANLGDSAEIRRIVLPDDPLPEADAIVSVGHVLSYLPDEDSINRALTAAAGALRPGGVLAIDLCDLRYGDAARVGSPVARLTEDWAIISPISLASPTRLVRNITTFVRDGVGVWRRSDEQHVNVLVDASRFSALLAGHGLDVSVGASFGDEILPEGLVTLVGTRHR